MIRVNLRNKKYNVNKDREEISKVVESVEASDDFYARVTLDKKTGYKRENMPDDLIGLFEAYSKNQLPKEVMSVMNDELQRLMFRLINNDGIVTDNERLVYNMWQDAQNGINLREKYQPEEKPEYLYFKDRVRLWVQNFEAIGVNKRQTTIAVITYFLITLCMFILFIYFTAEANIVGIVISCALMLIGMWRLLKCFSSL